MLLSISQITKLSNALTLVPARDQNLVIQKLSWDSRTVQPGMLFIAMNGETFDGNDFIIEAFEKGAAAVLASRQVNEAERLTAQRHRAALLYVTDALEALQRLATEYRDMLDVKVVGITGSSGKTSTKAFVNAVLEKAFLTVVSMGNRNNEIGLPATVLSASPMTEILVLEMAMRGFGQIRRLCEIARPQVGIITNIGSAHLELLGSKENIVRAKAELIEALPQGSGIAILNGDDPFCPLIREIAKTDERAIKVVTFGLGQSNDFCASNIEYDELGCPSFDLLSSEGTSNRVHLSLAGSHSIYNSLAAAATGFCLGLKPKLITSALEQVQATPMRQVSHTLEDGTLLIDDTYNANPDSMRAALEVLSRLDKSRLHIAVLGDMGELGPEEEMLHREVGACVGQTGVDVLITIGSLASCYAEGALSAGMDESCIISCPNFEEAIEALVSYKDQAPIILVKASRFMCLERIVEALIENGASSALRKERKMEMDFE